LFYSSYQPRPQHLEGAEELEILCTGIGEELKAGAEGCEGDLTAIVWFITLDFICSFINEVITRSAVIVSLHRLEVKITSSFCNT
jgi:hypothetical protein